jgi:hypothetical protein
MLDITPKKFQNQDSLLLLQPLLEMLTKRVQKEKRLLLMLKNPRNSLMEELRQQTPDCHMLQLFCK